MNTSQKHLLALSIALAAGTLTGHHLRRVWSRLRPRIGEWRLALSACAPVPGLFELSGVDAVARWTKASLDVRRAAVETLVSVTIERQGAGPSRSCRPPG